mmetsp:Transcript_86881/g.156498  ORF Transcript_86881/g.156498 Transcript_86881/m.156498 type:complete len:403 (+) Transcript_86881:92-1300(+)
MGGGASASKGSKDKSKENEAEWDGSPQKDDDDDDVSGEEEYELEQEFDIGPLMNPQPISNHYVFGNDILSAGTGQVTLVRKSTAKATDQPRAIKQHNRKVHGMTPEKMRQQVFLLNDVRGHPNIIKVFEVFSDKLYLYEILEYCGGGRLLEHIVEAETHSEREAACVMQQVLRAIEYMHSRLICHRDIKPEHILFKKKAPMYEVSIKLVDFSKAVVFGRPGQAMTERVGAPYYAAPQVYDGRYTELCDLWAAGIIMYLLLLGFPEREQRFLETGLERGQDLAKMVYGRFKFSVEDWSGMGGQVEDLLSKMLQDNESDRCSAKGAANHEWMDKQAPQPLGSRVQVAGAHIIGLDACRSSEYTSLLHRQARNKMIKECGGFESEVGSNVMEGPKSKESLAFFDV